MQDLKKRFFQFSIDVAELIQQLQKGIINGSQLTAHSPQLVSSKIYT